jgi:prepilin-type N-terminal cleavage/methylation domain-containing protein
MSLSFGRKDLSHGFTLIEILIATAILSIVLAAIYSTFSLGYRAIEGMDESMMKLRETRKAIDILRRELDSACYDASEDRTFLKILDRDVYGKPAVQLTFTAFSTLRPGLSRISYYIEEHDKKLTLFKKLESPFREGDTEGVDIIEDMEGFTIEAKYNDQWVKTWDTEINKQLPPEIKISLAVMVRGQKVTLSDISKPRYGNSL